MRYWRKLMLFAAALACAGAESMDWHPPKDCPVPIERVKPEVYAADVANLLNRIEQRQKDEALLPEKAGLIRAVNRYTQGELNRLLRGDLILKIDEKPIGGAPDFNALRLFKTQTVSIYSPQNGFRSFTIEPGQVGFSMNPWTKHKPAPAKSLSLPHDPRWDAEIGIIEKVYPQRPDLIETALFRAIKAGCAMDARLQGLLADIAMNDRRYADAMAYGWFAMDAAQPDAAGARAFFQAAIADSKLDAAIAAAQKVPALADAQRIRLLQELLDAQKALPATERLTNPISQTEKLVGDSVLLGGKILTRSRPEVIEVMTSQLTTLRKSGHMIISNYLDDSRCWTLSPEMQNLRLTCTFVPREFDPISEPDKPKHFFIGVVDMDMERGSAKEDPATAEKSAQSVPRHMYAACFARENVRVCSPRHELDFETCANFGEQLNVEHTFDLAILRGQIEMVLDGKRLFHGTLSPATHHLALTFGGVGVKTEITRLHAYELQDEAAYATKIKEVVNQTFVLKRTRLHDACAQLNTRMVEMLLQSGADPRAEDAFHETPLQAAARQNAMGKTENITQLLLSRGAQMDLLTAAAIGDAARVAQLLKADPKLSKITQPWPALSAAAWRGDAAMARLLVENSAPINVSTDVYDGETPLMAAVRRGKRDVFDFLLSKGAGVNQADTEKRTALYFAMAGDHKEMAAALAGRKAVAIAITNQKAAPVLSKEASGKLPELIARLGSDEFAEREKASIEIRRLDAAAVAPLRTALSTAKDPEIVRRLRELVLYCESDAGRHNRGVSLHAECDKQSLKMGEKVKFILALRNKTDKELDVPLKENFFNVEPFSGFCITIRQANGHFVHSRAPPDAQPVPLRVYNLKPRSVFICTLIATLQKDDQDVPQIVFEDGCVMKLQDKPDEVRLTAMVTEPEKWGYRSPEFTIKILNGESRDNRGK